MQRARARCEDVWRMLPLAMQLSLQLALAAVTFLVLMRTFFFAVTTCENAVAAIGAFVTAVTASEPRALTVDTQCMKSLHTLSSKQYLFLGDGWVFTLLCVLTLSIGANLVQWCGFDMANHTIRELRGYNSVTLYDLDQKLKLLIKPMQQQQHGM